MRHGLKKLYVTKLLFWMCLWSYIPIQAQNIVVKGTVTNQEQVTLEFATVLITDTINIGKSNFVQTARDGSFIIPLKPKGTYKLEVFYLGYQNYELLLGNLERDTTISIQLTPAVATLEEVIVRDTLPPIIYKPDTVTYNAKAFYTGRERKLGELIDKLPGLSIDDDNQITYKGKTVETLLIEDKPFFGGNSELALNGLPADAVGRVELLEDYNPLGFSLDPMAEKRLALNILLRPEKKHIIFGEAKAGGGPEGYYDGRVDLFKYHKKYNLYVLSGLNNDNRTLLSFKEQIQLLGGPLGIDKDNFQAQFSEVLQSQPPPNVNESKGALLAMGSDFMIKKKIAVHTYGMLSDRSFQTLTNRKIIFDQLNENQILENQRNEDISSNLSFVIRSDLKTTLPNQQTLSANFRLKGNRNSVGGFQNYQSNFGDRMSSSFSKDLSTGFEGVMEYIKRSEKGHVNYLGFNFNMNDENDSLKLDSDVPFLDQLIPWSPNLNRYILFQSNLTNNQNWDVYQKYVHRFSAKLYFTGKLGWQHTGSELILSQLQLSDMPSRVKLRQNLQYASVSISTNPGDWKLIPRLQIQHLSWRTTSDIRSMVSLLPEVKVSTSWSGLGKFDFSYKRSLTDLNQAWFIPGEQITNFNTFNIGNPDLTPFYTNSFSLAFQHSVPFSFANWGITLGKSFNEGESITNQLFLDENDRIFTFTSIPTRNSNFSTSFRYMNFYEKLRLRLFLMTWHATDFSLVEQDQVKNTRSMIQLRSDFKFQLNDYMDLSVKGGVSRNAFERPLARNLLYHANISLSYDVQYKNFLLNSSLHFDSFDFTSDPTYQGRFSADLSYQEKNAAWSFHLIGSMPLFGETFVNFNQNDLFYEERRQEIFPSYLIVQLGYKF